ncbi:MAG: Transcriptional regulator, IclR family [uncultured Thermomicrobiales bacterium]|uniref:Transcriptional regulator, IclR family n=1 Tax=uncultured Thermomicrobiales bacterium TaxID=1645740 RepID=A0A6J4UYZ2_9BACT|nr:MAG: Transcriptional regulator, IclR family [uncultured Thermomicrobiales bacterium]
MQYSVLNSKTCVAGVADVGASDRYTVASVQRAVRLLGAFMEPPHQFGVSELSRRLGQTKNQTFRLLQTLVEEGVVVMDATTKKYSLGYRMFELGSAAQRSSPLVVAAAPVLDRLAGATGETINLGALADDVSAICLDKRESGRMLQITARVGRRFPLHAGAISKLLLANVTEERLDRFFALASPLPRFTPRTLVDPDELRAELAEIRRQGYAVSDEDLDLGACSVAAPICGRDGRVVAGLSIASPSTRFGPTELERARVAVMAAGAEISARLRGGG